MNDRVIDVDLAVRQLVVYPRSSLRPVVCGVHKSVQLLQHVQTQFPKALTHLRRACYEPLDRIYFVIQLHALVYSGGLNAKDILYQLNFGWSRDLVILCIEVTGVLNILR